METIKPFFKKQDIVIAVSSSDEYSPYLCVYLESLKENASKDKQYDIVIFERNISERNKKIILEYIQTKNISIRTSRIFRILIMLSNSTRKNI